MKILTIPNPILNQKCEEVTDFSGIPSLVNEVIATAKEAGTLAGLASNQVGLLDRFFVMNIGGESESNWQEFINPKFIPVQSAGKSWSFEGCGSIPKREALVERWNKIAYTAQDVNWQNISGEFSGFLARVFQHEEMHLRGILLTNMRVRQWRNI